jgi:glyoxylase-like metal-dependent hydrolase (beta-lactamase superfamily II)
MERFWGEFVAVPAERIHVLKGGETLLGGRFRVAYTPGHASHHVSYLHEGTAFVGDVGGVRISPGAPAIPPTPPPDIDLDAWHRSLQLIAGWRPQRLAITHFGATENVEDHLREIGGRLDRWGVAARDLGRDGFIAFVREEIERSTDAATAPAYFQAAPLDQLYAGLERYWRKLAERAA